MTSGSHFKTTQFNEPPLTEAEASRVVKTQTPVRRSVEDFEFKNLHPGAVLKSPRRDALVAQSEAPHSVNRFQMSQLAREALGMEAAEKQRLDQVVKKRVGDEVEVARALGIKEGYAEGLLRGKEEALSESRAQAGKKMERLDEILASMEAAKVAIFEANQKFLIDLSFRVGRAVLLKELSADREYITRLSRELVDRMGLRENLTLKLNPDDLAFIDELKQNLQTSFGALRNLAVEVSSEVHGGGAILETEWGAIDASLDTQLANIQAALQSPPRAGV